MLGGDLAARHEVLDSQRRQPRAEALRQRAEGGGAGLQLDHERRRLLVAAVGGDEAVEERVDRPERRLQRVRGAHDLVERGDVGIGRLPRLDRADAELVVARLQPVDVRVALLERGGERPVVESGVDR